MWENLSLKEVTEYAKDPYPSIRQWKKDTGRNVIGSTIADVPEEVIYAFGFLPVALLGTSKPLKKAAEPFAGQCLPPWPAATWSLR